MSKNKKGQFSVGYRRPPRSTQFKPGHSGNRKGRPKGSRNFTTVVQEELRAKIAVTEEGRKKRITKREAVAKRVVNNAVAGDFKAIPLVIQQEDRAEISRLGDDSSVREEDRLVMENIVRRIRASTPKLPPASETEDLEAPQEPSTGED